jgi:hypothetical protein
MEPNGKPEAELFCVTGEGTGYECGIIGTVDLPAVQHTRQDRVAELAAIWWCGSGGKWITSREPGCTAQFRGSYRAYGHVGMLIEKPVMWKALRGAPRKLWYTVFHGFSYR